MEIAQQLALWADELRAITGNGLQFVKNPYDQANYQRLRQIAAEMFALAGDRPVIEPQKQLSKLLGHYTPMVMGDALVFNAAGQLLLIQRADSGLWAAPGGAFDTGETAAQGAVRECYEETGWQVEALALIGIYDSRVVGTFVGQHVYHLSFLCRPFHHDTRPASHSDEVLAMGWFAQDALPPLDVGHRIWAPKAFEYWRDNQVSPYFDP